MAASVAGAAGAITTHGRTMSPRQVHARGALCVGPHKAKPGKQQRRALCVGPHKAWPGRQRRAPPLTLARATAPGGTPKGTPEPQDGEPGFQDGVTWFCYSTIGLICLADFSPLPLLVRGAGDLGGAVLAAAQWGLFVAPTIKVMVVDQGYDTRRVLRLDTLPEARHLASGLLGGACLWTLVSVATASPEGTVQSFSAASQVIAPPQEVLDGSSGAAFSGGLGGALVLSALSPAVAEELLFRGFLLTAICSELGRVDSVFVAAAMFGLIHLDPAHFFGDSLLGLAAGGLALLSGSVVPPIVLHAAHNAAALLWGASQCKEVDLCGAGPPLWSAAVAAAGGAVAVALAWPRGEGEGPGGSPGEGGGDSGQQGAGQEGAGSDTFSFSGARASSTAAAQLAFALTSPPPPAGLVDDRGSPSFLAEAGASPTGRRGGCVGEGKAHTGPSHRGGALVGEVIGPDVPGGLVWLFGYGAMMAESVWNRRGVSPVESMPASCPVLIMRFNHLNGYANLDDKPADRHAPPCVHGVLLLITREEFARVKAKEGGYRVRTLESVAYDGRRVRALYFQSRPETRLRKDVAPRARYLDKLQRGARQAGVEGSYQEWLAGIASLADGKPAGDEYGDAPSKQLAAAVVAGAIAAAAAACAAM